MAQVSPSHSAWTMRQSNDAAQRMPALQDTGMCSLRRVKPAWQSPDLHSSHSTFCIKLCVGFATASGSSRLQGQGAYGRVYKALRGGVQDVAVKRLLHTGEGQLESFVRVRSNAAAATP